MLQETREILQKEYRASQAGIDVIAAADRAVQKEFAVLEEIKEYNQLKVNNAFRQLQIEPRHFAGTTGYGYGDVGRDTLEALFALVFGAETALVRPAFASATHALACVLFGLLRPNDTVLSVSGRPYDTLEDVIGLNEDKTGSLAEFGVLYDQVDLKENGFDIEAIEEKLKQKTYKLIMIQRSAGYSFRSGLELAKIETVISKIKAIAPQTIVMVDNCYGEFVETREPCQVGADIAVGSLIKNPGGGIAPTGAYVAGKKELVEQVAYRLTAPGTGGEVGSYAGGYLPFYQGLFLAPHTVCEALKGAVLCAKVFEDMGYDVKPKYNEKRTDIIQAVRLGSAEKIIRFCQCIQASSPVESHVLPEPWDIPGYNDQVIMAAGAFVQGSSIELSADAPIREPYTVYTQGGLVYEQCKLAYTLCCNELMKLN